jgi:hypothetical protein
MSASIPPPAEAVEASVKKRAAFERDSIAGFTRTKRWSS